MTKHMKCKHCNNEVLNDAKFCNKCGKPIEVEKKEKTEIKGIGGWLSFFLFGLFVSIIINFVAGISDISGILETTGLTNSWLYSLVFLDILYFGGLIAFTIYTILAFSKLKENAVSLGKMYLILIFLSNFISVIFSAFTGEPIATETSYLDSSQMVIRSLVYSVIWFLYLTLSKRVNNTFPKEKRETKTFDKLFFSAIIAIPIVIYSLGFIGSSMPEESVEQKDTNNVSNYFSSTEEWKVFNSTLGQFQATFPSYPTHETDNIQIPDSSITLKYDSYLSEVSDGTTYFVNTVTYSSEIDTSNPETNLEGSLNGMVASSEGNEVVSSNFTYFDGHRALDYKILNKNENIYLQGKIILVEQTLYQLMVAYESGNYNEVDYNKFINSFNLK